VLDEIELRRAGRSLAPPEWTENGRLLDKMGIPLRRSTPSPRLSAPRARSPARTYLGEDAAALTRGLKASFSTLDNTCRARGTFGRHSQMKWQIPYNCAKQATTGLHLSTLAANDFEFAGDRRASIDERLAKLKCASWRSTLWTGSAMRQVKIGGELT